MVGLRGSYHFMPILQKIFNKPPCSLIMWMLTLPPMWAIARFLQNGSKANMDFMDANQRIRGGAALGVRRWYCPASVFLLRWIHLYGYGSFGLTTVLK